MKLLVLADLHLDDILDQDVLHSLGKAIRQVGQQADALIIADDLTDAAAQKWPGAIRWLGRLYPPSKTVLIPGNHDYYGGNLGTLDGDLDRLCRDAGCGFGQCRCMVLGDTRILMTTLWTDMRLFEAEHGEAAVRQSMWQARQGMPDYGYGSIVIGNPERELRPKDTPHLAALNHSETDFGIRKRRQAQENSMYL